MALRQQQVLYSGVPDRKQPIFTDPDGHVPHPDIFTRRLRKLYKQCGLSEEYHLHTLRHFYATYLLQEGTSKQVAASPARSCRYGILGAHLLPPAGHGETAGRKADARSAEQPKSVLCCIYEK